MNRLSAVFVVAFGLLSSVSFAQQGPASPSAPPVEAPLPLLSGEYWGNIDGNRGWHAFQMVIKQNLKTLEGSVHVFQAHRSCTDIVPISGTIQNDGTVVINAPGVVQGCDRTFTLKLISNDELAGEMVTPSGLRRVKIERK